MPANRMKNFRLDDQTKEWLIELAEGRSESEVIRELIRDAAVARLWDKGYTEANKEWQEALEFLPVDDISPRTVADYLRRFLAL